MRRKKHRKLFRIFKPPPKKYFVLNFSSLVEIFLIFLLIGLFVFFFKSDFFKVAFIDCEKDGFLCSDKDLNLFTNVLGRNIFLVNKNDLARSAKFKNIALEKVQISKKLPNRLIVKLEDRKPLAVLSTNKANFLVDENGFVFSLDDQKNSGLPTVLVGSQQEVYLGAEVGEKISKALELVKVLKSFFLPGDKLAIQKESLTLYAPQLIATFSASRNFFAQAGSLQLLLSSSKISQQDKIIKIDLRFDKPVVILNE